MPKISALIKEINKSYASYVNLTKEFNSPADNRERMKGYRPISSHREAIQRLIKALIPNEHKIYALRGSYGTGKSHLFLMLANYFNLTREAPETQQFFSNYAKKDRDGAEKMKNWHGEGRYLVTLCRYGLGDDFEATLLRALKDACQRENFEGFENTHYHEALRRINDWKLSQEQGRATGRMYELFLDTLAEQYPEITLAALEEGLSDFDHPSLRVFRTIFASITGGEFTPDQGNLIDILKEFVSSKEFKQRFQGLVFFYDEFDEILKEGNLKVSRFQIFAETCRHAGIEMQPIMFYANIHKPLQGYANAFNQEDFQVVRARLKEIPLVTQGIEDIIAAIVIPDQDSELWQNIIASKKQTLIQLVNKSRQAQIFPWRSGVNFQERIIEDLYPMHPMATHCLVQLSQEIGSNARSLFTFFTQEDEDGCYRDFITDTDIETNDRLNFYTVDCLFSYFREKLSSENVEPRNEVRKAIQDFHASYRQARNVPGFQIEVDLDPLIYRLLKTILIYKISTVTCTFENICFGLNLSEEKRRLAERRLGKLVEERVLFKSQHGIYEFRQSDIRDFQSLIELYKTDPNNVPENLAEEVMRVYSLAQGQKWLEAKEHNDVFYEDKRLKRLFIVPRNLTKETFDKLYSSMMQIDRWKDRYEGLALYVLCETIEDIKAAREYIEKNGHKQIIVGIPQEPIPIRERLMDLKAIQDIQKQPDLQDLTIPEQARIDDLLGNENEGILGRFLRIRKRYFSGRAMVWFSSKGDVIISQPGHDYNPADQIVGILYRKRNRIAHGTNFNKIHVSRTGSSNTQLHDAVKEILDVSRDIKIDTSYGDNRGEIRYLRRCFVDVDALAQKGVTQGTKRFYQVAKDTRKYQKKLPTLADMVTTIDKLEPNSVLSVGEWLSNYQKTPYGQGPIPLTLYLAFIIRRFGDALSLKKSPNDIGTIGDCPPSLIYELVDGAHPNAVFEKREITPEERELISGIYHLFTKGEKTVEEPVMLGDSHSEIQNWWAELTPLEKNPDIYKNESTQRFLTTSKNHLQESAHRFITGSIQTVYGYERDDAITKESVKKILRLVEEDKELIETVPEDYKRKLVDRIFSLEFFTVEADVPVLGDYKKALEEWYKSLDDNQRDPLAEWHTDASKAIVRYVKQFSDIMELILETIPSEYGFRFGVVDSWSIDYADSYLSKFENALRRISENAISVSIPEYSVRRGEITNESGNKYQKNITYRGELSIGIKPSSDSQCAYLTTNGDDPRNAESQRQKITQPFTTSIKQKNVKYKFCSQANDGKYGKVVTIEFIDKDQIYVIKPAQLLPIGEAAPHRFPEDPQGLQVSIESLVSNLIENTDVTKNDVKRVLEKILQNL